MDLKEIYCIRFSRGFL